MANLMRIFILTRFNLRLWPADKHKHSTRTDLWLQQRFELFERYCFPSVRNQSVQDFEWIVLFDVETPLPYRKRVESYRQTFTPFTPYLVPATSAPYFARVFQQIIATKVTAGDRVVTVYLDNDDALRFDYLEEVKRLAGLVPDKTFISFAHGLQYVTSLNMATHLSFKTNHFISFVEICQSPEQLRTVFGYGSHMTIEQHKDTHVCYAGNPNRPAWLEVVHTTNVINRAMFRRGTRPVTDANTLRTTFGIDITLSRHPRWKFCTAFLWQVLGRIRRHF